MEKGKFKIGYTTGAFDLFHVRHLNIKMLDLVLVISYSFTYSNQELNELYMEGLA